MAFFKERKYLSQTGEAIKKINSEIQELTERYNLANSKFRLYLKNGLQSPEAIQALDEVRETEQLINMRVNKLRGYHEMQGDLKTSMAPKELGLAAGVGAPGLAGLSYMHESWKNE